MENWIDAKWEVPAKHDLYLVIVSGSCAKVTLRYALCLAYFTELGWIIDGYEEIIDPDVLYWRPVPEFPEDIKAKLSNFEASVKESLEVIR